MVQRMAPKGREVILGGKRDPNFGPVILFGLGGIFVEVFQDVVWRLAPIRHEEAARMIQGIRGSRVLAGYRGEGPSDVKAIQDLLVRLSQMLAAFPGIQEIDVNPVVVLAPGEGALGERFYRELLAHPALCETPMILEIPPGAGNLTLNQLGTKGVSGTSSVSDCWNK